MANPTSKLDLVVNGVTTSYDIHDANAIPRSGGSVMTGDLFRTNAGGAMMIGGGDERSHGGDIIFMGTTIDFNPGGVAILPQVGNGVEMTMWFMPDGTWVWTGQAVQLISDARLKQQITEIDDALLDAWEDVELSQFKYNDAVDEKGSKARLHTGYVVQQIDEACKKHNVDVSKYGLYCHEEYPQETEEVEITQEDGTIKKETKVIREASEHYSLRYTEALIVECKYLRRCVERLVARIEKLEGVNKEAEITK